MSTPTPLRWRRVLGAVDPAQADLGLGLARVKEDEGIPVDDANDLANELGAGGERGEQEEDGQEG